MPRTLNPGTMCIPAQLGCCNTAPFRPHLVQRADRRSMSLEAAGPHLMIKGTKATGFRCMQCSQTTQHHSVPQRRLRQSLPAARR
jgi:hypothetical protein